MTDSSSLATRETTENRLFLGLAPQIRRNSKANHRRRPVAFSEKSQNFRHRDRDRLLQNLRQARLFGEPISR
jgi:hypothetical protein